MAKLLHGVVATCIIVNDDKYLIIKRSKKEKNFSNYWSFPGGKIDALDYDGVKKATNYHWHNVVEYLIKRECKEEVGIDIENLNYLKNAVFLSDDGSPTLVVSFYADGFSGKVRIDKREVSDYAWVTLKEANHFQLIPGLLGELEMVDKIIFSNKLNYL